MFLILGVYCVLDVLYLFRLESQPRSLSMSQRCADACTRTSSAIFSCPRSPRALGPPAPVCRRLSPPAPCLGANGRKQCSTNTYRRLVLFLQTSPETSGNLREFTGECNLGTPARPCLPLPAPLPAPACPCPPACSCLPPHHPESNDPT